MTRWPWGKRLPSSCKRLAHSSFSVVRIILTRAAQQQAAWAQALAAAGHEVLPLALLEIALLPHLPPPRSLQTAQALMFVSSNAVEGFFKQNWPFAAENTAQLAINTIANRFLQRCWGTGPGTVAALLEAGVDRAQIDAPTAPSPYDSESLWQLVSPQVQSGTQVLILRGRDVWSGTQSGEEGSREWLAEQIEAAGGEAERVVVYERRSPAFDAAQLEQMQTWLSDGSLWLISSSQALQRLPLSLNASQARCLCTHERIAQAARARGFAVVYTSRPTAVDVLASIKSLHD